MQITGDAAMASFVFCQITEDAAMASFVFCKQMSLKNYQNLAKDEGCETRKRKLKAVDLERIICIVLQQLWISWR